MTLVWPVIAHGAATWGDRNFACIESVQNRAMRYYLDVCRYTPTAAVAGDMGWDPVHVRQWKFVGNFWSRLCSMDNTRLTKKVFYIVFTKTVLAKTGHTEFLNILKN